MSDEIPRGGPEGMRRRWELMPPFAMVHHHREDVLAILADNARLRALLAEAHGMVADQSLCSCDDTPSVPCEMARAIANK